MGILTVSRVVLTCSFILWNAHGIAARHYVGEDGCGYVGWTNAPKVSHPLVSGLENDAYS